jgi:hypothetical protein
MQIYKGVPPIFLKIVSPVHMFFIFLYYESDEYFFFNIYLFRVLFINTTYLGLKSLQSKHFTKMRAFILTRHHPVGMYSLSLFK